MTEGQVKKDNKEPVKAPLEAEAEEEKIKSNSQPSQGPARSSRLGRASLGRARMGGKNGRTN
jgi:hypothetical protein